MVGVLVIDDSKLQHTIVSRYLAGTEFIVRGHAYDGDEAVRRCQEVEPDVILLDMVMGATGGREALDLIMKWNPRSRVAVASALAAHDLIQECREAGARAFLPKPFTQEDLVACLRRTAAAA